jgi:hypothetical protein
MKYWYLKYTWGGGGMEQSHASVESAQRGVCALIVDSLAERDPDTEDTETRADVLQFFALINLGGYSQALAHYERLIDKCSWNEEFVIEERELLTEADTDLLAGVANESRLWSRESESEEKSSA